MMKHLLIALILASTFSACRLTTENEGLSSEMVITKTDRDDVRSHAILTFEKQVFDFGIISQGERLKHTFEFENTGEAPLLITAVKPSCGCTLPKKWPKEPIESGKKGVIEVEFNSDGKSGTQHRSINIVSNGVPQTVVLYLQGTVIAPDRN